VSIVFQQKLQPRAGPGLRTGQWQNLEPSHASVTVHPTVDRVLLNSSDLLLVIVGVGADSVGEGAWTWTVGTCVEVEAMLGVADDDDGDGAEEEEEEVYER